MTACVRDSKVNRSMLRFTLNGDILVTKRRINKKKRQFRGEAYMQLAALAKCMSRLRKYEIYRIFFST